MRLAAVLVMLASSTLAEEEPLPGSPTTPPPTDAQCGPLPSSPQRSFRIGEELEFTLDALGAKAGKMTVRVMPLRDGRLPIQLHAETNTFFSNVRRVKGDASSALDPVTLRPRLYLEESDINGIHRTAAVTFSPDDHQIVLKGALTDPKPESEYHYAHDGLDSLSTMVALRQLPMREGLPLCMDVYGIRRMWRLSGTVLAREHITIDLGEFDAWHLTGWAVRMDDPRQRREMHVWISDDARRLPLVAVGTLDLGIVRATLSAFRRPGERPAKAENKADMKW